MKIYKLQLLLVLVFTLFFGIAWQKNCGSPDNNNTAEMNKNMNVNKGIPDGNVPDEVDSTTNVEMKTISEGSFGKIEEPFIFVARTEANYKVLQNMLENMPAADTIDFKNSAVIAAFAGEKNTGGYSVAINGADGKFTIKVNSPPPDAIVTEALTMPYKVVIAPINKEDRNIILDLSDNWTKTAENFKVTGSKIEFSGGIAGRIENFKPEGSIKIYKSGEFVTLFFDLQGKTAGKKYQTTDVVSGKITGGNMNLPNFEATNLIERPHPPFVVSGTISGEKLSLELKKSDADFNVSDGFQGSGKIEAEKTK